MGKEQGSNRDHGTDVRLDRVPPQSIDVERRLLGELLECGSSSILGAAISILGEGEPFYKAAHQKIYGAILALQERGDPIDLHSVSEELANKGELERIGGVLYLYDLCEQSLSPKSIENIEYYAKIIFQKYTRRRLIIKTAEMHYAAYDETEDVLEVISSLQTELMRISRDGQGEDLRPVKRGIKPVFSNLQELYQGGKQVTGIPTGFIDLDAKTSGFQNADYILVAGRPSMGKSAFVLDVMRHVAIRENPAKTVVFFSLEMSEANVLQRFLAAESGVATYKMRTGRFQEVEWPRLTMAASRLSEAPIFIDASKPNMKPLEIRSRCHKLAYDHKIDLIVIDHIQLMRPDEKMGTRNDELTQISLSMKALAREFDVPVIVVSQLSRSPEGRPDKRPILSDLRASGSLEQDSDMALLLYRAKYYNRKLPDNIAEIIIAKQRNGPVGMVSLLFDEQQTCFRNLKRDPRSIPEREPGEEG